MKFVFLAIKISTPIDCLLGSQHIFGLDPVGELLFGQVSELESGGFQRGSFFVRGLCDFRGLVVSDVFVQSGDQHEGLVHDFVDVVAVGLDAHDTVAGKCAGAIGNQFDRPKDVRDDERLEDVQLEMSAGSADGDCNVIAHDLSADHRHRLALSWVDLSGHDRRAGLVLRQAQLAQTASRSLSIEKATEIIKNAFR